MGPGFESPEVHHPTVSGANNRVLIAKLVTVFPDGNGSKRSNLKVESVLLTQWVHPFPFRTRKLSAAVVKILGWRRPGKITQC